jgi:hypothetical protein
MQDQSDRRGAQSASRDRQRETATLINVRNAGLERIGRTTRWMVVGAVGVTGAVGVYAEQAFRSHHAASASAAAASTASGPTATSTGAATSPTTTGIQASTAPAPAAPVPSPVVSGGS